MCGIVGFIGNSNAKDVRLKWVFKTLKNIEGYDSQGLSLFNQRYQVFDVFKDVGRVDKLIESTNIVQHPFLGLGHTRWATHGKVNKNQ